MKNKKGVTLLEMVVVLALLTICGSFMGGIMINAMRSSIRNQMINEASILGLSAKNYLKDELSFATEIKFSTGREDGYAHFEITGAGTANAWLKHSYSSADGLPIYGGNEAKSVNFGTSISLSNIMRVNSTTFNPDAPVDITEPTDPTDPADALYMTLTVSKNGQVYYNDSFMIKCLNIPVDDTSSISGGRSLAFINYKKP